MTSKTHAFEADTGKILDIVINSLYSNKEIFLRELISNASDAIDKRRYMAATNQSLQSDEPAAIKLIADSKAKTLTIQDNGIGFSKETAVEKRTADGGYGINNVEDRLLAYFGSSSSITIDSKPGAGTTVFIKIPKKSRK